MYTPKIVSTAQGFKQTNWLEYAIIPLIIILVIPVAITTFHDPVFGGNFWLDRGAFLIQYLIAITLIALSLVFIRKLILSVSLLGSILLCAPRLIEELNSGWRINEEVAFAYTIAILTALFGLRTLWQGRSSSSNRKWRLYLLVAWFPILYEIVGVILWIAMVYLTIFITGEFYI